MNERKGVRNRSSDLLPRPPFRGDSHPLAHMDSGPGVL